MSNPLEAIWNLFFSPDAAAEYKENPQEYIDENGLGQCDPAEINELVALAFEKGPVNQGATVGAGGNQSVGGSSQSGGWSGGGGGGAAPPPPPPLDPNLPPAEALEQTINYYITNNTTTNVDDRDTNVDSSVNTTVVTDEGDVTLGDIDTETTTASGDGAVAAGENAEGVATGAGAVAAGNDINAPVNTGSVEGSVLADDSTLDGVAVGDGNTVVSDSTNVATGDGSSVSDDDVDVDIVSAGDVAVTDTNFGQGNTVDDSITTEYTDSFNTTNTDSFNTDASTTNTDSFNTDASTKDSFNTDASTTNTDSFNTDASIDYDDSFNTQSQDIGDESSAAPEPADDPMDV